MVWVTQAQLARELGITEGAVGHARRRGVYEGAVSEGGMYDLHKVLAIRAAREEARRNRERLGPPPGRGVMGGPPLSPGPDGAEERKARARKAIADAELAELRVAELAGRLVARERVERVLFDALRLVRDKIRIIPDDAPTLAHETDEHVIRTRLQRRIDDALASVADDILATPDEDEEDGDGAASA